MLIFSPHEMKYIWHLPKKKVNFLYILYSTDIQKSQPYFLHGRFSFDLTFFTVEKYQFYFILNSEINAYQKQIKLISITSENIG